jgi:iron complex outermembrane recepter protein
LEFDAGVRFAGGLPALGVDSYWAADARAAWRPVDCLEISLVAQNLFDESHPEWAEDRDNRMPTEMERSIYGKISWKF